MPDKQRSGAADAEPVTEAGSPGGRVIDSEAEPAPASRPAVASVRGVWRGTPWLAGMALLLALAGWLAGYLAWQEWRGADAALRDALSSQANRSGELGQGLQEAQRQGAELEQRLAGQAAALQRQQQVTEQAYEVLRKQLGQDRNRWIIAEAEYLMRVASTRLLLARDVPAALVALGAADQRLGELADPSLIGVRTLLAEESAALRAVPKVDIEGLALSLASLAKRVETLPVLGARYRPAQPGQQPASEPLAAARSTSGWKEAMGAAWGEIKGLVDVRRTDVPVKPMLAPEHEYFLYHNLRLQIDAARLALLRGEAPLFAESLRGARDWVRGYFEREAPAAQALVAELERMLAVEIAPPLPDISASLRALRNAPAYRAANEEDAS